MITADDWRPIGVPAMEPAALEAIRATGNTLVVAGPGTGKTELLGQRAAFLLQTGRCVHPRRILAISFKRDAAANLRDRVERRCGPDLARRFDSMTFDAFAKQLLDRFWRALPAPWALQASYSIAFSMSRRTFADFLLSTSSGLELPGHPAHWAKTTIGKSVTAKGIHSVKPDQFQHGIQALCLRPLSVGSYAAFLQLVHIRACLDQTPPALTFPMIGRLAEAIIVANPQIRAALCATYSHVFLDEFQDTTSVQYSLVRAIFEGGLPTLTAVGDDKQRIMGWAGARKDVFEAFTADFLAAPTAAGRQSLTRNYRSNERIVQILNVLKARLAPLEPDFIATRAAPPLPVGEICSVLVAKSVEGEASAVANLVAAERAKGTDPRNIGLLVRQKAVDWEERIKRAFADHGLAFRNEDRDVGGAAIQDLMTEPYSQIMLDILEFSTRRHGGNLWTSVLAHVAAVEGLAIDDDEDAERALAVQLDEFHRTVRILDSTKAPTERDVREKVAAVEAFLELGRLRSLAPQYLTGDFLDRVRNATLCFLLECAAVSGSWIEAIQRFRGIGQTPLLTITKSKGLEYDLVVLLGLNDDEWWSFDQDPGEGHSTFFVAASRARERLMLTMCGHDRRFKIREIFDLLREAGVPETAV